MSGRIQQLPNWESIQLGQLASFRNGINFGSGSFGHGLRIINVADFGDRTVPDYGSLTEVSESALSSQESLLADRDIVAVRSNGNRMLIGRTMFIRQPPRVTHSAFTIRIRVNEPARERLLPEFLAYVLRGPMMRSVLSNEGHGTNISNLNQEILKRLDLRLPPMATQRKIVAVLSVYDDLIENNNNRITLLQKMTQRIYREWFVNFRYPGHENVLLVNSELGLIPEGWTPLPASEALIINPRIMVDRTTIRPFIPMTSLSETGMHIAPIEKRAGTSGAKFQNGDTLFARITPCLENGKTAYVQCLNNGEAASGSTEFIVLRSRRLCPEYVYLLARSDQFRSHAIKSMSGASGRQRVRDECFHNFLLPAPTEALIQSFAAKVRPLFQFSYRLFSANATLRSTRDLLLPRLISGEIDTTDLDIAMPEAAA